MDVGRRRESVGAPVVHLNLFGGSSVGAEQGGELLDRWSGQVGRRDVWRRGEPEQGRGRTGRAAHVMDLA